MRRFRIQPSRSKVSGCLIWCVGSDRGPGRTVIVSYRAADLPTAFKWLDVHFRRKQLTQALRNARAT